MGNIRSLQLQRQKPSTAPTSLSARKHSAPGHLQAPIESIHSEPASEGQRSHGSWNFADLPLFPASTTPSPANRHGLPHTLKTRMEALSGIPMNDVRVHYRSALPAQLRALAYTQGTEIHIGPGQEQHLAHEAWHAVQQKQGRVKSNLQAKGLEINDDRALEQEADEMARPQATYQANDSREQHTQGTHLLKNIIQAKWIRNPRHPDYLVWDRPLNGLRWCYITEDETYFFVIEDEKLRPQWGDLEGSPNARTREQWVQAGFTEKAWKESDREIVPFYTDEGENIKLANMEDEVPRGFIEEEARKFLKGGEVGDPSELSKDFISCWKPLKAEVLQELSKTKKITSVVFRQINEYLKLNLPKVSKQKEKEEQSKQKSEAAIKFLSTILDSGVEEALKAILEKFGEQAYCESLAAATNLMKRFQNSSKKTFILLKGFDVYHLLAQRFEQLKFRETEPIRVKHEEFGLGSSKLLTQIQLGTHISDIEVDFDVLARRTGANKDSTIKHIHEVDLAFVRVFRGVTEAYANPRASSLSSGFIFQGGGGVGEKVFAVGHKGATDFRADVQKTEERFYALIFPKGFVNHFGHDLMTAGKEKASAREPNEQEFSKHKMPAKGGDPDIDIPLSKMFFIRAEKSTPDLGQVDIHFGWRDMIVNGSRVNLADFFRHYALAVVEFTKTGRIIKIQILKG